jgi:microcin C transport system permease protein
MTLSAYILRRLLLMIPTFFGITIVCFGIFQIAPGGPVETYLAKVRFAGGAGDAGKSSAHSSEGSSSATNKSVTDEVVEELKKRYNFDKPIHIRYWLWLKDVVRLEFGYSHTKGEPVLDVIASKLPVSVTFGVTSFLLTYLICIPLGILKAVRDGSRFDVASSAGLFIAYSIPEFMLGILLIHFFAGGQFLEWFPIQGLTSLDAENLPMWQQFFDAAWHMVLPLTCYMIGGFTMMTMLMKNSIIEQIKQDYVRSALARGVSRRVAILKHALRNALLPLATGFGGILTLAFAGSIIIERIFNLDGIGRLSYEATLQRDYPILMASITITSILGLLGQLVSDLLLRVIDPRIDFSERD